MGSKCLAAFTDLWCLRCSCGKAFSPPTPDAMSDRGFEAEKRAPVLDCTRAKRPTQSTRMCKGANPPFLFREMTDDGSGVALAVIPLQPENDRINKPPSTLQHPPDDAQLKSPFVRDSPLDPWPASRG